MNVTNNLKLPQYTEEDIFDLQDINKAYNDIDNAYKEVIDFKNEIPKTNATAEVINARGGKETLGKRLDEFGSQLDSKVNKSDIETINSQQVKLTNDIETINSQMDSKANEDDLVVERNRIDLLVKIESGQTEGNTELLDIRVGTNGETYETAGEAIRKQLNAKIDEYKKAIDLSIAEYIKKVSGSFTADSRFLRSDYIRIDKNSTLVYSELRGSTSGSLIYKYDLNKTPIGSLLNGEGYNQENTKSGEITIDEDCYICVSSYITSSINPSFALVKKYENLVNVITSNSTKITQVSKNVEEINNTLESLVKYTSSKLYGKKIGFLGDSYIANNNWHKTEGDNIEPHTYTWAYKIAKKYNMEYNNYGVNGSAITKVRNSVPSFRDRYADMKNDLDYVVIVGGRNDFNLQVDIDEFKKLLNGMLLGLIAKYPSAKMCFFTPWCVSKGSETFSQEDYANAIIEICGKNSIPVFDSYHKGGMYMHQKSFRAIYSQGESDVSHLNNLGHDLFIDKAESFILSI